LHKLVTVLLLIFMVPPATWCQDEFDFAEKRVYSRGESIAMSVLMPGLGQVAAGHKVKGGAFLLTYLASAVVALNSNENYKARLEEYRKSEEEYQALRYEGTYEEAEAKWRELREDNRELDRLHNIRVAFFAAAATVYIYNLIDAIFLTSYETWPERRVSLALEAGKTPRLGLSIRFGNQGR